MAQYVERRVIGWFSQPRTQHHRIIKDLQVESATVLRQRHSGNSNGSQRRNLAKLIHTKQQRDRAGAKDPRVSYPRKATGDAAWGVVGPDRVELAAVPLNGGGNRSYFLGLYGARNGRPVQLRVLSVADLRDVEIHDGRIVVSTAALSTGDSYCCPSHLHRDVYSFVNGRAHLEAETLVASATPTPQPPPQPLLQPRTAVKAQRAPHTSLPCRPVYHVTTKH